MSLQAGNHLGALDAPFAYDFLKIGVRSAKFRAFYDILSPNNICLTNH